MPSPPPLSVTGRIYLPSRRAKSQLQFCNRHRRNKSPFKAGRDNPAQCAHTFNHQLGVALANRSRAAMNAGNRRGGTIIIYETILERNQPVIDGHNYPAQWRINCGIIFPPRAPSSSSSATAWGTEVKSFNRRRRRCVALRRKLVRNVFVWRCGGIPRITVRVLIVVVDQTE